MRRNQPLSPIEIAAVAIYQARNGDFFAVGFETSAVRDCYVFRKKYHLVFRLAVWAMILMEIMRRPHWTFRYHDWSDADRFIVSNIHYVAYDCIIALDIIALIVLGLGIYFDFRYEIYHCSSANLDRIPNAHDVHHTGTSAPPPPTPRALSTSVDTGMQLSEVSSAVAEDAFSYTPSIVAESQASHDASSNSIFGGSEERRQNNSEGERVITWQLRRDPDRYFRRVALYVLLTIYILKWCEVIFGLCFVSLELAGRDVAQTVQGSAWTNVFPLECVYAVLVETNYIPLLKTTLRTVPRFLYLLFLIGAALLVSTAAVKILLHPHDNATEQYFESFSDGLWTMFNIMNAANWPDPFVACYKESKYYFFFFLAFLVFVSWGLVNMVSAILLVFFRAMQRSSSITSHTRVLMNISTAFESVLLAGQPQRQSSVSMSLDDRNISNECMRQLLGEYCSRFGGMDGISATSWPCLDLARSSTGSRSQLDIDIALAYLNYRYQLLQYICYEKLTAAAKVDRSQVGRLLAAIEITTENKPLLGSGEYYSSELNVLCIEKLLDLYNGTIDVSQFHLGLADPAVAGSLKKIGFPRNIFFQFFIGVVLQEDCLKLYEAMPALSALMVKKKKIVTAGTTMRPSSSAEPTCSANIPYYMSDSVLQHMALGVDVDANMMDRPTIDGSVFSVREYHHPSLMHLAEYSQHHPMMYLFSPPTEAARRDTIETVDHTAQEPLNSLPNGMSTTPALSVFDMNYIYFDNDHRLQWLESYYEHRNDSQVRGANLTLLRSVNSLSFEMWHNAVIVVACMLVHLETAKYLFASIIVLLCVLETLLRVTAKGMHRFLSSYSYMLDAVVTILLITCFIGWSVALIDLTVFVSLSSVRLLLFLPTLVMSLPRMRPYRKLLKNASRRLYAGALDVIILLLLLLLLGIAFAALGTKLFGGFIQSSGNDTYPKLVDTTYGRSGYFVLNFNDVFMSMTTLFTLLMVNNMDITAEGVEATSVGLYARLYFVCWYAVGVVFVLNLFMTVLLNTLGVFLFASYVRQTRNQSESSSVPISEGSPPVGHDDESHHDATPAAVAMTGTNEVTDASTSERPLEQFGLSLRSNRPQYLTQFFDDDLYTWMIQGRVSALSTQVEVLTPESGAREDCMTRPSMQVRDAVSGDTSLSGSLLAVTLDHSADSHPASLLRSTEGSLSNDPFEQLLKASIMGRQSNATDLSMRHIPAFLADGTSALYGSDGSSVQDESALNAIVNQRSQSISIAQRVASLLQSAREETQHVKMLTTSQYAYYVMQMKYIWVFRLASWFLCVLPFFSRPFWTYKQDVHSNYDDADMYPNSNVPIMPTTAAALLAIFLLSVISWALYLEVRVAEDAIRKTCAPGHSMKVSSPAGRVILSRRHSSRRGRNQSSAPSFTTHTYLSEDQRSFLPKTVSISSGQPTNAAVSSSGASSNIESRVNSKDSDGGVLNGCNSSPMIGSILVGGSVLEDIKEDEVLSVSGRSIEAGECVRTSEKPSEVHGQINQQETPGSSHNGRNHIRVNESERAAATQRDNLLVTKCQAIVQMILDCNHVLRVLSPLLLIIFNSMITCLLVATWILGEADMLGASLSICVTLTSLIYLFRFNLVYMKALSILFTAIPEMAVMLTALAVLVVIGGAVGRTIFRSVDLTPDGQKYFGDFGRSIWNVFVAITSSSFPDQIVASYDSSRTSIIYFFVVISVGAIVYLNVLQIVVFTSFEYGRHTVDATRVAVREYNLELAFRALDVLNLGYLTPKQINDVLDELYEHYFSFRQYGIPSSRERVLLTNAMDTNGDGRVYRETFMMILELTRITVVEEVEGHFLSTCVPWMLSSPVFLDTFHVLRSRQYRACADAAMLVITVISAVAGQGQFPPCTAFHVLLSLMIVESALKLLVIGPKRLWTFPRHRYDAYITGLAVLSWFISFNEKSLGVSLARIVIIIRSSFFLRNLNFLFPSLGFSFLMSVLNEAAREVRDFTVLMLAVMYSFASLGMVLFGGLINKSPDRSQYEELQNTDYGERDLYPINFNDMAGSFVLLVCCLHISSWDTIAGGFSSVTSAALSRTYFVFWYCIGVLLFMKVITSFFISAFVLKLGRDQNDIESDRTDPGDNEHQRNLLKFKKRAVVTLRQSRLEEPLMQENGMSQAFDVGDDRGTGTDDTDSTLPTPQETKRLYDLSLRFSVAVDSMRHLRRLLREDRIARRGETCQGNTMMNKRYSVNFKNTHLSGEDMEGIMSRMIGKDAKTSA